MITSATGVKPLCVDGVHDPPNALYHALGLRHIQLASQASDSYLATKTPLKFVFPKEWRGSPQGDIIIGLLDRVMDPRTPLLRGSWHIPAFREATDLGRVKGIVATMLTMLDNLVKLIGSDYLLQNWHSDLPVALIRWGTLRPRAE